MKEIPIALLIFAANPSSGTTELKALHLLIKSMYEV
jgi:hypothetical protein